MKCTQCDNQEFIKRKGIPVSISGDASIVDDPNSSIEGNICTKCGHIEWFDIAFVKHYESLRVQISDIESKIYKLKEEFDLITNKTKKIVENEKYLNEVISSDLNSVKTVNEAKQQLKENGRIYSLEMRNLENLKSQIAEEQKNATILKKKLSQFET